MTTSYITKLNDSIHGLCFEFYNDSTLVSLLMSTNPVLENYYSFEYLPPGLALSIAEPPVESDSDVQGVLLYE